MGKAEKRITTTTRYLNPAVAGLTPLLYCRSHRVLEDLKENVVNVVRGGGQGEFRKCNVYYLFT